MMKENVEQEQLDTCAKCVANFWREEIIRETEHYFQGEMQHDQRASWLLTTTSVLIAVIFSFGLDQISTLESLVSGLIAATVLSFLISGIFSLVTILPLVGTRYLRDVFGVRNRKDRILPIDELIAQRFRFDQELSLNSYDQRLRYHFRAHYVRANRKAINVLWSALFLLLGLVLLTVAGLVLFVD